MPSIESGRTADAQWLKPKLRLSRVLIAVSALCACVLALVAGYRRETQAWVCLNCAITEYRVIQKESLVFGEMRIRQVVHHDMIRPLTTALDPQQECHHQWHMFAQGECSFSKAIGMGPNYAIETVSAEPDFSEFIAEHPGIQKDLQAKLRESFLQRRRALQEWLVPIYEAWKRK